MGLDPEKRDRLQQETEVLGLATMVKTQLDYTTTMILLDCEAAPFGLERLALTSRTFAEEMNTLGASLQTAIEGRRPRIISPRSYLRSRNTAPAVEQPRQSARDRFLGRLRRNDALSFVAGRGA